MKVKITGRIWIETPKGTYAGIGRITLLERIKEYGSITDAAKSMKMSYRKAWEQIESMNVQSGKKLVEKVSGGAGGGGSRVTEEGDRLIQQYNQLMERFQQFAEEQALKMN